MTNHGFDPSRKGVLFFSRGRGRGHAAIDIEVVRALQQNRDDVDVRFVSYASGAGAIAEAGMPLIELELPELNPQTLTTVLAAKLVGWLQPALVVAHEEFAAMTAAAIFDVPTVFLTDWFVDADRSTMHALQFADEILFLDEPGHFEEPPYLAGKVRYVGRYQRQFTYTRADRGRAREELRLPPDALVVAVLPGVYATEERAPFADAVLGAFDLLDWPQKRMIWVAGNDAEMLRERTRGCEDILILNFEKQYDRVMVAADVAITKSNRKTVLELEGLGIPQVAVKFGLNPIDEKRLERVGGLSVISAESASPTRLFHALLAQRHAGIEVPTATAITALGIARRISEQLR